MGRTAEFDSGKSTGLRLHIECLLNSKGFSKEDWLQWEDKYICILHTDTVSQSQWRSQVEKTGGAEIRKGTTHLYSPGGAPGLQRHFGVGSFTHSGLRRHFDGGWGESSSVLPKTGVSEGPDAEGPLKTRSAASPTAEDPERHRVECCKNMNWLPKSERDEVWSMLSEVLKEQHSDAETTEFEPPKKKISILLVASDSDDEHEHTLDHTVLNRH
ncbi:hypothetical protein UY3_03879 [Chelonia mydas]|uniref:Uncharacterized protein n=1 Tax=Chelonia mydas TaxID=8469 RepID=M7CDQ3_CHEMY|nr:hypothetical protein UY3_03879 [Chelonia mydas]